LIISCHRINHKKRKNEFRTKDDMTTRTMTTTAPVTNNTMIILNHDIVCPGITDDYKIVVDTAGYKVVANRRIKKGEAIMQDSLEFNFSDVRDGDSLWLGGTGVGSNHKKPFSSSSSSKSNKMYQEEDHDNVVPERIPVTRDMLLRTHGVNYVIKMNNKQQSSKHKDEDGDEETVVALRHYLEVPTMFVNHSCDPSMTGMFNGVDTAARDLEIGDELTVDYATYFYDDSTATVIPTCWCGAASSCRGKMLGFGTLSATDQERLMPMISPATLATCLARRGEGPPVRQFDDLIPRPRMPVAPATDSDGYNTTSTPVMRLMWPGPSWAEAKVVIKKVKDNEQSSNHQYGLYAAKDVQKGQLFYEFWRQRWPTTTTSTARPGGRGERGETIPYVIDMVFSASLEKVTGQEQDDDEDVIPEGTVVARFDVANKKCCNGPSYYRNVQGELLFSGWEMLSAHSCDPNVVYRNKDRDEEYNWQSVYAAKNIKKGDRVTMDWNCFTWDARGDGDMTTVLCKCGASNCVGSKSGFKHLSLEAQTERLAMTWSRNAAAGGGGGGGGGGGEAPLAGKALSPYVRAKWKKEVDHVVVPHDEKSTDASSSTSSFCDSSSISETSKED
jgi:SET domain